VKALSWVLDQLDTLVRAIHLVRQSKEAEDCLMREYKEQREVLLESALEALARAYAYREGLRIGSVRVKLSRTGELIVTLPDGEERALGYLNSARPN
jgi:hypothetical protein